MGTQDINRIPQIGEIYLVRFDGTGHEQKGLRPGVIFRTTLVINTARTLSYFRLQVR